MSAHTPGPWRVGFDDDSGPLYITAADDFVVVASPLDHWDVQEGVRRIEDARLIAAAPELLEALSRSRGQWIHSVNAELCLAAIAKATGAAP